ncbi:MAG: amidohydrolase family protein [Phycisphaerae bacterium]|nr:amidohydrolase family protein [Phycisphaerae bacterium]
MPDLPTRIIDFHVHLFPDRMFDAIWASFAREYGWDVRYRLYYRACIEHLRARGVETIVYSNYAHRRGIAAGLNEWNLRVLEETPGLYCLAAYHPDDDDGIDMARRLLEHPRVIGFKLQLMVQRFHPYDRRMYPLYEMVMEKGKRLLFHAGTAPVSNEFVGLAEFRKLLRDFPELPATVAHMGSLEYGGFLDLLEAHPGLYLDTAFSFCPQFNTADHLGLEALERYRDRIVYGSDFPNLPYERETEIATLVGCGVSQGFLDAVFHGNGRRLIGACAPG